MEKEKPKLNIDSQMQDEIRMPGIKNKGFGQISKYAMLDKDLPIAAKGILAYFCSYCGGGNSAFPGRDKILRDLNLSVNTYYKYLNRLIENGYISVIQSAGKEKERGFHKNIYTIEHYPKKFEKPIGLTELPDFLKKHYRTVVSFRDIYAAGYGTIPKIPMLNEELSVEAKGVYAYLCACSGAGYQVSPTRENILTQLGISHNSANKYIKELLAVKYITASMREDSGKFGHVMYVLNQYPETETSSAKPEPKICDTQISPEPKFYDTQIAPQPKICDTQNEPQPKICDTLDESPEPKFCDTKICDTNSNLLNNINNNFRTHSLNHRENDDQVSAADMSDGASELIISDDVIRKEIIEERAIPYRYMQSIEKISSAVKLLSDWNHKSKKEFYDSAENPELMVKLYKLFVQSLSEMLTVGNTTNVKGAVVPYSRVYDLIMENYFQIDGEPDGIQRAHLNFLAETTVAAFMEAMQSRKITNYKSYMKTIIWTVIQDNGLAAFQKQEDFKDTNDSAQKDKTEPLNNIKCASAFRPASAKKIAGAATMEQRQHQMEQAVADMDKFYEEFLVRKNS